jgi:hypothetical protein
MIATKRCLVAASGGGGSVATPAEQSWQSLIRENLSHAEDKLAGSFPPQCDLRAVYAKNSRIATRSRMRRHYRVPWKKTKLHQAPGIVFWKIDALQNSVLAAPELHQIAGDPMLLHSRPRSESRLHLDPDLKSSFYELKSLGHHSRLS